MKLIIGLGNSGDEYTNTRHNLGFLVADELAKRMKVGLNLDKKLKADVAMFVHNGETIIIAKPQTFMNLSGDSVAKIANFYKVSLNNIWVISDDLDLDFGIVRTRVGGSSGGHNGLKDIITKRGEGFVRFRVGIKNPQLSTIPAEKFVLQKFNKDETSNLDEIISTTADLITDALKNDVDHSSHSIELQ